MRSSNPPSGRQLSRGHPSSPQPLDCYYSYDTFSSEFACAGPTPTAQPPPPFHHVAAASSLRTFVVPILGGGVQVPPASFPKLRSRLSVSRHPQPPPPIEDPTAARAGTPI